MKKLAILLLSLVAVAGFIAMVMYTNYEEERQHSEEIERSKRIACKHMKQKYGIDVEAVNVYGDEKVNVVVSDGEKDFHVKLNNSNYIYCSDDYQAEEIENALFDMVKADIPTACEFDFDVDDMHSTRYDGDNLDKVLSNKGTLYVYCVNADFEEVPVFDFLRDNIYACRLYSFSSQEIFNDFIEQSNNRINRYSYVNDYALFIDDYCIVSYSSDDYKINTYNIQEYNDLMYYLPYATDDIDPEIIFEEIHEIPFDWAKDEYEFITGYGLKEDCDLYVWLPIPEDKKDKEFYWVSEYSDYNDKKIEETQKCRIIDGYAVTNFIFFIEKDVKFALVCK